AAALADRAAGLLLPAPLRPLAGALRRGPAPGRPARAHFARAVGLVLAATNGLAPEIRLARLAARHLGRPLLREPLLDLRRGFRHLVELLLGRLQPGLNRVGGLLHQPARDALHARG